MLHDLMLVCEEAFVNICHYGFPGDQPRLAVLVEVAVDERNRLLHLAMSDQGIAYNPLGYEPRKAGLGEDLRIGGLGILLMREYVDELRYERLDGCNVLRMTKPFV